MSNENIAIISVSVIIVLAIIGFLVWRFVFRKKKSNSVSSSIQTPNVDSNENHGVVKLIAVKRLKGSEFTGYETAAEVKKRLDSIKDKKEFEALNINERPFSKEDWAKLEAEKKLDEIEKRNKHEQSMLYRYLPDGKEIAVHAEFLTREF